jgi:sec-independent protein translocase protein TatB
VFGVSFPELLVLGTVALLVLGPEKLPGMLRTMGQWVAKLRRLTTEVRHQSGIDEVLRAEGFEGGLNELRSVMRGGPAPLPAPHYTPRVQPAAPQHFAPDKSREYPVEGPDAYGALPEDLLPTPAAAAPAPDAPAPADTAAPVAPAEGPAPAVTAVAQPSVTEPGARR